jgi:Zn-dependent peptidase ImmA (M78 family)/transcriptional regulator with XRE-family HTH domain
MFRLAREMRGISQTALAALSGIPQPLLSRIEANVYSPASAEIERVAEALEFPPDFFLEPDAPAAAPLFRKRAIRSVKKTRMIQARINVAVLAARRILEAGIEINTPTSFPEPGEISREDPARASQALRSAWLLPNGRIDDLTAAIEAAGGVVLHVDFGSDDVSAAFVSALGDPRLWFLVNSRERAGDRVRLSLAHELGHAVLHRYLPVQDDRLLEPEAYAFASTFLLPPEEFDIHVKPEFTLRQARDLKRTYWVSLQAIIRAARDRDLVTPAHYVSLCKQISARRWRTDEPDEVPVERPVIWPEALAVHRHRHGFEDDELAAIARLQPSDLATLFPRDFPPRFRVLEGSRPGRAKPPSAGRDLSLRGIRS